MPRDGSGNYSLPSGNPVVTGTTISSTTFNNTASDIATALAASLAANGEKVPTANLPMGGYKLTGLADGSSAQDSATTGQVRDASDVGGNVLCPHRGLTITYATAATVDVVASVATLENSSGDAMRITSLSVTIDITASGAAGLDTGSEASSTWYYVHAIAKSDGTKSALLSTSFTAPQLPTGYTFWGLLGVVRNDSNSDLVVTKQVGSIVTRAAQSGTSNGTDTSFTAVGNGTAGLPPIAKVAHLIAVIGVSSGTAASSLFLAPDGATTSPTYGYAVVTNIGGGTNNLQVPVRLLLTTAQQVKYYVSGTNAQASVLYVGWEY